MAFKSKKKLIEKLKSSFGKLKKEEYNFELIEKYFRNKDNSQSFQVLSDKICSDLDFQELFMFLDRTNSKVGQQYLYNKLRNTLNHGKDQQQEEDLINTLTDQVDLRIETQLLLEKLESSSAYHISNLFQQENLKPPKWFFIMKILSLASLLFLGLILINRVMVIPLIGILAINSVFHFWNKNNLNHYLVSIPQLFVMHNVACRLKKKPLFQNLEKDIDRSLKVIGKIKKQLLFFQLEAKLQGEFQTIFWIIMEFIKIAFLIEPLFLFGALKRLDSKRNEIEKVFTFVGRIDSLISIASVREGLDLYCLPTISESKGVIESNGIYHPLIINPVSNDIVVDGRSVLLTGSNMSGKTSFIRTIGVNIITGLTINTCFAESITIPRLKIYSAIRISDDLMNDKSYYFEEVLTIKRMLEKSTNDTPNLFLLDEIFKGTNTVERISAGKAVLSSLSQKGNIVFVSTHDIELADLLQDEYDLYHFSETVDNKNVDFDYKLKSGKLRNRNAIRILQINDYPESIVSEAMHLSMELDNQVGVKQDA